MKLLRTLGTILIALAAGPACAAAQASPPPDDCRDAPDRCEAEKHRQSLAHYGLQPIEAHLAAGDIARRAFFVDANDRDQIAITLVRAKGRDPILTVYSPPVAGEKPHPNLIGVVTAPLWQELIGRSEHFDRTLAPPALRSDENYQEIALCLHPWRYTVEATDVPTADRPIGAVRQKTDHGCESGLVEAYAHELAKAAVATIPPCGALDTGDYPAPTFVLRACATLTGDRLAAAQALNRVNELEAAGPARINLLFHHEAKLDWQGEHSANGQEAADRWTAEVAKGESYLEHDTIEGLSDDRVRLVGSLSLFTDADGKSLSRKAPLEQVWRRHNRDFVIEQAIVGAWQEER